MVLFSRFHAWQSAILFTGTFLLHLIFSFSVVVSWILLVVDVALIGVLGWKAYYDGKVFPFLSTAHSRSVFWWEICELTLYAGM